MTMDVISQIGILAALLAGLISFLSPCVLPLVPGYLSYMSGTVDNDGATVPSRFRTSSRALLFIFGFSTVFVMLGASATLIGRVLLAYRYETTIIGGVLIALFGIFMTGLVPMPVLQRDVRYHGSIGDGYFGPYLLGLAFGFGWTPCIGPVLGAILTAGAMSESVSAGIVLLSVYAAGLGIPFLLSALFTEGLMRRMLHMRRAGRTLKIAAGGVMIAMGAATATGYMSNMSYWMLEHFPILTAIG